MADWLAGESCFVIALEPTVGAAVRLEPSMELGFLPARGLEQLELGL